MEPVEISFKGKLVDNHEEGDFYYQITALVQKGEIPKWERAVATRVQNRIKNAKIVQELKKETMSRLNKDIKKRSKK